MASDPYNLKRFVDAQEAIYSDALAELRSGKKRTHWMWFVFPQIAGLGRSSMSERYAIQSEDEARAFLAHPVLGRRLVECSEAVLSVKGRSPTEIMGSPDDMKLRSSATLFASVSPAGSVFHQILDQFYGGEPDSLTPHLLGK